MANLSGQLQLLVVSTILLWMVFMGVAHTVFGPKGSAWVGRLPLRGARWLAKKLYRGLRGIWRAVRRAPRSRSGKGEH